MCTVSITIPDEFLADRRIAAEEASSYLRLMVAIGLYTNGDASIERAAQIAGINAVELRKAMGKDHAAMQELLGELEKGRRSGEEQGYIPSNVVRDRLRARLEAKRV